MIKKARTSIGVLFTTLLLTMPTARANVINHEVAKAYNEGLVRCGNPECARYLYACFKSYSASTLQSFLGCGTHASRLNENQPVVAAPNDAG